MSNSTPTMTVVLATHNGEAFLEKQLASLARQTLPPHELIVSDDASSDATNEIVTRFRGHAPFPVVHRRNLTAKGFRENFLAAAQVASGDWVAFCDQDDIWRDDKLAVCAPHMATRGVTQIAHQASLIDAQDQPVGRFDQAIVRTGLKEQLAYDIWGTFWGFSMLVDRRILGLVEPADRFVDYIDPRHRVAHDRWAFFLAQTLGNTVEIAEPLVAYRQHGHNLYGTASAGARSKSAAVLQAENAVYIAATEGMLRVIAALPSRCERDFPAFDRERALEVHGWALQQLRKRGAIYASGRVSALCKGMGMLLRGDYRNAQDSSLRWRSFLRDMALAVERR